MFSQFAVVYCIPVESYGKQLLREKHPVSVEIISEVSNLVFFQSLVQFMENVRAEVWPNDFTM